MQIIHALKVSLNILIIVVSAQYLTTRNIPTDSFFMLLIITSSVNLIIRLLIGIMNRQVRKLKAEIKEDQEKVVVLGRGSLRDALGIIDRAEELEETTALTMEEALRKAVEEHKEKEKKEESE